MLFNLMKKTNKDKSNRTDEFDKIIWSYDIMLDMRRNNKTYTDMFEKYGYKNIAIYGMGRVGKALVKELENSNIDIAYAIDQNSRIEYENLEIKSLDDALPKVDVMFVTIEVTEELEKMLYEKVDCAVIEWMTFLMTEYKIQNQKVKK